MLACAALLGPASACGADAATPAQSGRAAQQPGGAAGSDSMQIDTAGAGGAPAQDAGAARTDGAAPSFVARDDLDRSVTFEWTESLPGQGTCQPGKYTGTFTCDYVPNGGTMPQTMVAGPVTLVLEKSMNGEFLEISDGSLEGVAQGIFGFTAGLTGKLDCTTLEFMADAQMGVYGFGDPKVLPFGTFMGGLTGKLDTQTLVLSGQWSLTENSGGTCKGPWTATYTP